MASGNFKINSVDVSFPTASWISSESKRWSNAAAEMGTDILNRAIMNAPKASGALVRSGRLVKTGEAAYAVTFGDNQVRYAYRREYENKKNPQTLHYLKNAGESVQKGNVTKYFR